MLHRVLYCFSNPHRRRRRSPPQFQPLYSFLCRFMHRSAFFHVTLIIFTLYDAPRSLTVFFILFFFAKNIIGQQHTGKKGNIYIGKL